MDGIMTKDLALAIHGKNMKREHWVITTEYMDAVNVGCFYFFFFFLVLTGLVCSVYRNGCRRSSPPGTSQGCKASPPSIYIYIQRQSTEEQPIMVHSNKNQATKRLSNHSFILFV